MALERHFISDVIPKEEDTMKLLRKMIIPALCCLLAIGLAACGQAPAPTQKPDNENGGNSQIPNPMVGYENAEFPEFSIVGYPDRDGMKPTGFCLIGGTLAQIDYEAATLRCAAKAADGGDISGIYYNEPKESELTVGHSYCNGLISVTVKEYAEGTLALWDSCEGDYAFSLWLPVQSGEDAAALIEEFAANVHVTPAEPRA